MELICAVLQHYLIETDQFSLGGSKWNASIVIIICNGWSTFRLYLYVWIKMLYQKGDICV